jgi:hypothetical protein
MAEKPISPLRKLQVAASELNALSDKTSEQVRQLELTLNELSLGISVSVEIEGADRTSLEFCRKDDRSFHIAIVYRYGNGSVGQTKPWDQCSRDQKLQAIGSIPRLIDELVYEVDRRIGQAKEALDSLSQFVPSENKGGQNDGRK